MRVKKLLFKKKADRRKKLIKGSRIPIDSIYRHLELGWKKEQIAKLFPSIDKKQLDSLVKSYKGK